MDMLKTEELALRETLQTGVEGGKRAAGSSGQQTHVSLAPFPQSGKGEACAASELAGNMHADSTSDGQIVQ